MCRPRPAVLTLARIGFWAGLLVVAGFALYPNLTLPEPDATRGFTDKIYHGIGFTLLTMFAGVGWGVSRSIVCALIVSAAGLEFLQVFVEGRGLFFSDMAANFGGLAIGLLVIKLARADHRDGGF